VYISHTHKLQVIKLSTVELSTQQDICESSVMCNVNSSFCGRL